MSKESLSNTQTWFRALGQNLAASFAASAPVLHNVTKGRRRERQVLDVLTRTLPARVAVAEDVTITSMGDEQAPSFDGALLDRAMWPRLYEGDGGEVAMIESVVAALEVKSTLDGEAVADIFKKSKAVRELPRDPRTLHPGPVPVAAFAYTCPNPWLSYFDAQVAYVSDPSAAPSLVAILNVGVFTLLKPVEGVLLSVDQPEPAATLVFMPTGQDTLLFVVYLLSRWALLGSPMDQVFRRYSAPVFQNLEATGFDADFLRLVMVDPQARKTARDCFVGSATDPLGAAYQRARLALNLA